MIADPSVGRGRGASQGTIVFGPGPDGPPCEVASVTLPRPPFNIRSMAIHPRPKPGVTSPRLDGFDDSRLSGVAVRARSPRVPAVVAAIPTSSRDATAGHPAMASPHPPPRESVPVRSLASAHRPVDRTAGVDPDSHPGAPATCPLALSHRRCGIGIDVPIRAPDRRSRGTYDRPRTIQPHPAIGGDARDLAPPAAHAAARRRIEGSFERPIIRASSWPMLTPRDVCGARRVTDHRRRGVEAKSTRTRPGVVCHEATEHPLANVNLRSTPRPSRARSRNDSASPGDGPTPPWTASRARGPCTRGADLRVGRYHLIERLGRGSQGEVWKAVQLEPPVELVALKLLIARGPARPREVRSVPPRGRTGRCWPARRSCRSTSSGGTAGSSSSPCRWSTASP